MERNKIFKFKAPNGVEIAAIVVDSVDYFDGEYWTTENLCYAQNRLFNYYEYYKQVTNDDITIEKYPLGEEYGKIIVDYVVIPDMDIQLKNYSLFK